MVESVDFFQKPKESQIKNVKVELGDDDKLKHMEQLLETWIATLPYFPKNYDKNMVKNFLRFTKYNVEKTKEKLEIYYIMKNKYPELMGDRNPMTIEITSAVNTVDTIALPNFTEKGERIFLMRLRNFDVAAFQMRPILKYILMFYDLLLAMDHPVSSEIIIFDASGFTPAHVAQFMMPTFRNAIKILIKAYTFRLKEIHIVNAPTMFEKMVSIIKTVLHEKMRKRFIIHKSPDTILERFSEKLLPKDYGGCLKSATEYSKECLEIIQKHSDWYKDQETAKITEQIPKYNETCGELLEGLQGSFRKISID